MEYCIISTMAFDVIDDSVYIEYPHSLTYIMHNINELNKNV